MTDGTTGGTRLLRDVRPGRAGSDPSAIITVGGVGYFVADDGRHGRELWRTDGTAGGTSLVRDIVVGALGSSPVSLTAVDGRFAGLISVADPIRPSTPEAIRLLHEEGLRVIMLTGDNRTTAEAVARKLGLDEVIAEVLPQQKNEVVKRLQGEGRIVAMAGDGINDAPALSRAHVGIAMGSGTDIAMQSASVTLMRPHLSAIVNARALSKATVANSRQNLWFAFLYNTIGIPIAAGVLYPFTGLLLSPMFAAAAMSLEDHRRGFAAAMAVLIAEFNAYLDCDGADPVADGVSYRQGTLWLSPHELAEMSRKMLEVLRDSVANKPRSGRTPYLLSPILFPTALSAQPETRQ